MVMSRHVMLEFLMTKLPSDLMDELRTLSMSALGFGSFENVVTVVADTPMHELLKTMASRRLYHIPVLDRLGKVVNLFSRGDTLWLYNSGAYNDLEVPVNDLFGEESCRPDGVGFVTCRLSDPVTTVVSQIITYKTSACVYVDDDGKLEGLVTLDEIFDGILQYQD